MTNIRLQANTSGFTDAVLDLAPKGGAAYAAQFSHLSDAERTAVAASYDDGLAYGKSERLRILARAA